MDGHKTATKAIKINLVHYPYTLNDHAVLTTILTPMKHNELSGYASDTGSNDSLSRIGIYVIEMEQCGSSEECEAMGMEV